VMVGGDDDVAERCRPVFATYADPIVHLGPLGSGQVTKILNNLLFTANLGSAITTLDFGRVLANRAQTLAEVSTRIRHQQGARSIAVSAEPLEGSRRSPVHCCEGRPPRREPRGHRSAPEGAVFAAADAASSRWTTRDESGRVRRGGPHGRTHGAPPCQAATRSRAREIRRKAREVSDSARSR